MKRKLIISLLFFFIFALVFIFAYVLQYDYVRGRTGEHCYPIKEKHGNIKYPLYYKTLEECLNSLK